VKIFRSPPVVSPMQNLVAVSQEVPKIGDAGPGDANRRRLFLRRNPNPNPDHRPSTKQSQ